jgi:hypothetical protein
VTLDDFLPYVLHRTKGAPAPIAVQAVRLAVIELCREALLWREFQTSQNTVALQTAYPYTPAAGQQVCRLLDLSLNGSDIEVVTQEKGRRLDIAQCTDTYAYGKLSGFELRPAQVVGLPIITYSAVAPSLTAATVPDDFGRYVESIAKGTLWRLYSSPDLQCYEPGKASDMLIEWMAAKGAAKGEANDGFARATTRSAAHWF